MPRTRFCWTTALAAALALAGGVAPGQEGKEKEKPADLGANRDVPLVQRLLAARSEYQLALEDLRKHYLKNNDIQRGRWAEEELLQYHRVAKQAYVLELEVPPPTLKGTEHVPQANLLFRQAKAFKAKAGSSIMGTESIDNLRRAEILFQRILHARPDERQPLARSDKISPTAYELGDLYEGSGYKQYSRAAVYFERCYQWNPRTNRDARLRAARLYDRQLNNHAKAGEIYRDIIKHETDEAHIEEAKRRTQEMSNRR